MKDRHTPTAQFIDTQAATRVLSRSKRKNPGNEVEQTSPIHLLFYVPSYFKFFSDHGRLVHRSCHSLCGRCKKGRGRGKKKSVKVEGRKGSLPYPLSPILLLFPFLPIPYPFQCLLHRQILPQYSQSK